MKRSIVLAAMWVGLLAIGPVAAERFPAAPVNVRIRSKAELLSLSSVQKELGLTDGQITKAREIASNERAMQEDLRFLIKTVWPEEREAKTAEVNKRLEKCGAEVDKKLEALLTEEQMARLEGIHAQVHGLQGLFLPKVGIKVGMTQEQRGRLEAARKKWSEGINAHFRAEAEAPPIGSPERKAWGDQRKKLDEDFEQEVLSSLTAEQLESFEKLRGKPMEFPDQRRRNDPRWRNLPSGPPPEVKRP